MTDKTIENCRKVGGDYFKLIYSRRSNLTSDYFLKQFNFNDYHCFKSTGHQREMSYEDFLEFKYAVYIFFKKELYDKDHILKWIGWIKNIGRIQYLHKPLPPFNPEKIIIKK